MPKIISHTPKKSLHSLNPNTLSFVLTCQSGLETLVRKECEKLGLLESGGQDRLVMGKGDLETLYKLLIGSRFANRVYIEVAREKILDFDTLHDLLESIDWRSYVTGKERIIVEAASTRSILANIPSLQSVAQKAIFSTLHTPNYTTGVEVHILILIVDDIAHILLDVTGDPLHKRGYRSEAGEAPIKENLASALVAFLPWKYREPLIDPCCGAGTIPIEAAMIARNIAPGLERRFRIESLPFHDISEFTSVKNIARMKSYPSGEYKISGYDINPEMIEIARQNAKRAGVSEDVRFEVKNALDIPPLGQSEKTTIVTNPPYGNRIESDDIEELYKGLETLIEGYQGGYITSIERNPGKSWSNKKLLNGSEECRYWYKKF